MSKFQVEDQVSVLLADLKRPLYGEVREVLPGYRYRVNVFNNKDEAMIEIDEDQMVSWWAYGKARSDA